MTHVWIRKKKKEKERATKKEEGKRGEGKKERKRMNEGRDANLTFLAKYAPPSTYTSMQARKKIVSKEIER
ncbi:hypothetical protein CSUI_000842 [Cystoisospora suis]|uniref:Uncharacterized protein n=1 Tax=Cystoisospora suis TaxID=483139 RepID=A0A2C6LF25_9APIC|nr:hypothetical protein CSUI_000842 [Cystoisospora suis]